MRKLYFDVTKDSGCTSIFMKDAEVIRAGTTVYSMSVKDKNDEYRRMAEVYDIHFIFDEDREAECRSVHGERRTSNMSSAHDMVNVNFFTIPWVDIFARDSKGGYIATVGALTDLESDAPICYIDKDRKVFLAAENFKSFIENVSCWREKLQIYEEILFFATGEEARKQYEFIELDPKLV